MLSANSIKSDIEVLKKVAVNIKEKAVIETLEELSEKISTERFYLVIVGLFKRGKSSIINALIGRELAPVAVTPLTSVITFFQFGPVTRAEVKFKNNSQIRIDLHDIFLYVSEEHNPKNGKNVEYVRLITKADILENVTLVDTPGLGSLFSHNTTTTLEFLPRIDAALFVLSADVPISKADEEFLRKIKDSIPNVIFILNKSDLLTSEELEKMLKYNTNMLYEIFGNESPDIQLIPVSTRQFFSSKGQNGSQDPGNIGLLRKTINHKIIGSRDEILLARATKLLLTSSEHLKTLLTVKADTLQMPVQELEKKKESMQNSIDYLASGKEDFDAVVKSRIQQLIGEVTEQTEKVRKRLVDYYFNLLIENKEMTWKKVKSSDAGSFFDEIAHEIIKQFEELKEELERSVKEEFSNILLQYSTLSRSFLYEIIAQMKEILGINIEGIIATFDLDVYTSFYFKTDYKYSIPSVRKKVIFNLVPDPILKNIVLKNIYRNCLELINPNSGRVRGDIDYKISESYRKFKYHFDQKLFDLLQSLKKMIEESIEAKLSIDNSIEETLEKINADKGEIEKIIQANSPVLNSGNTKNNESVFLE